ncbi:MAG: hypothetical protein U0325_19045 [Polyangiales bacterium]
MTNTPRLLVAALSASACLALAAPADAVVRVGVSGGVQHLLNGRGTYGLGRVEASAGVLPWVHLGGYAQLLEGFDRAQGGWGAGGELAFRPSIPGFRVDPMAFATAGYQRLGVWEGFVVELGAGLTWHVSDLFKVEARGQWVNFTDQGAPSGFTGTLGLALSL